MTVILVLCVGSLAVSAAETSERTGLSHAWMTTRTVEYPTGSYNCEKLLEKMPVTMEAWVYLPGDSYASLAGTILGNKPQKNQASFTFSIEENGVPQLSFEDIDGEHKFKFANAVIPADTWTHIAVVYGTGTDGKQVYCYINGELKQASATSKWYAASTEMLSRIVGLAGDRQQVNMEGFRGILGDVTVYSDVRTAGEILSDVTNEPNVSDTELLMYYDLDGAVIGEDIKDSSKNGYNMIHEKMWLTQAERDAIFAEDENAYSYTIAFIPDIQISTRLYYSRLKPIFSFLVDNKESMNIQYAISLGDLTDNNTVEEWDRVLEQYNRLNDIVPYALIRGNHDIERNEWALLYDEYFSSQDSYYYHHVQNNGGFYDTTNTQNTYLLFSAGQVDYIILNLDFGASDDVLAWADRVLNQYPRHRAIIVTHGYLQSNGQLLTGEYSGAPSRYVAEWNDADDMWDKLIRKHANIDLVACGHVGVDHIVCSTNEGDHGNTVYQMLSDTQYVDRKILGAGIVTLMHFTEDGRFARVEHYSTVDKKYFRESNYDVTMDFGEAPGYVPPPEAEPIQRYCQHCESNQTWQPVTSSFSSATYITDGHYYLVGDTRASKKTIQSGNTVCLDLNGYTYTANEHLILEKGAALNIQGAEGTVRGCGSKNGDAGRTIWIKAGAELNLHSGTLTALSSTTCSAGNGGVLAVYGTFNMYGGMVRDGISGAIGGNLFVDRAGSFNMYGGEIRGGTAKDTGNCVYTRGKTLLANDAVIDQLMASPKSGYTTVEDLLTIQGAFTGKVCFSYAKITDAGIVMGISKQADLSGAELYFSNSDLQVRAEGDTLVSYMPKAASIIDENGMVVYYDSIENAVAALVDGQTLVLHRSTDSVEINKSILLDLNGRKISNTLSAVDDAIVEVIDCTTADYTIADEVYGKVKAISGQVIPAKAAEGRDPYVQYNGSSYISYHAVGLNIQSMALRPQNAGLYYLNNFVADSMVRNMVNSFGIVLSVDGIPDQETMLETKQYTSIANTNFGSKEHAGMLLSGILKESNNERTNLRNGEMTVYGRAYVELTDGSYLFGLPRSRSLREQAVEADKQFAHLNEAQKQGFAELYEQFPEILEKWELNNLESYLDQ